MMFLAVIIISRYTEPWFSPSMFPQAAFRWTHDYKYTSPETKRPLLVIQHGGEYRLTSYCGDEMWSYG